MSRIVGTNKSTYVVAKDEAGAGGANHKYEIRANITPNPIFGEVSFQNGAMKENVPNGIMNEDLLMILIDRLQGFQSKEFKCRENAIALTKLEEALMWLRSRTNKRIERGVEGTSTI